MRIDEVLLEYGRRCLESFDSVNAVNILILLAYGLDRFLLLRHLPLRTARMQWSMAVLIAIHWAYSRKGAESGAMERREEMTLLTAERMGIALSLAAMLTTLDRVLLWWRSRRRVPAEAAHR